MGKTEAIWHFGEFTVVNSWNRTRYSTTEKSEIFRFCYGTGPVAVGYYSWSNRPWQRYGYESSLDDALTHLLESISRTQYEQRLDDINKIRKALKKMENYEGAPRD